MTDYYIAPDGDDSNPGTEAEPFGSLLAVSGESGSVVDLEPGDTVYVRGGTYYPSESAWFGRVNGTEGDPITITRYPGDDRPFFDGSEMSDWDGIPASRDAKANNGPLWLARSSHVTVEGLGFRNCPGVALKAGKSEHVTFRDILAYRCGNAALKFYLVDDGVIEDCEAYDCAGGGDSNNLGSADAFAITGDKGTSGATSKRCVFRRNVGHHCSDDGVDFYAAEDCEIHDNVMYAIGYRSDGTPWAEVVGADLSEVPPSKGFKLGGGAGIPPESGGHRFYNNLAYRNLAWGVGWNGAEVPIVAYNNTAIDNGVNGFGTFNADGNGNPDAHELVNNVAMGNGLLREAVAPGDNWGDYNTLGDEVTHERNSWNIGYGTFTVDPDASTTPSDPSRGGFETLADTDAYAPRDPDAFADLTADSPFVDAGRSLGDAYPDSSTDLGAFPYDASSGPTASLSVVTGSGFATPAAVRVLDGDQWVPGAVRVRAADGDGFVEAFGATGGTVAAATGSGSSDVSTAYVEAFDRASPLDDYVGTPAAFEVTDRAFVGAHALRHTAPGDDHLVLRGDGDGAIPRGEDVRVRMYAHETGNYGKLYVCASGSSYADVSGYAVEYDAATSVSPALKLLRYDDGTLTALDETPLDPPTGEWLSIELYTTEGRLAAGLSRADGTQLAAVRAVDDTYRTGTYGFGCNDPGVSFDALERL